MVHTIDYFLALFGITVYSIWTARRKPELARSDAREWTAQNNEATTDGGEESEHAGVKNDGLPILSLEKPGWWSDTHTCNDVYQVENKIKSIAAEALRGASSLNHKARGNWLANELDRWDSVTGES